jgi:putative ABC transport system substrate-binding protein
MSPGAIQRPSDQQAPRLGRFSPARFRTIQVCPKDRGCPASYSLLECPPTATATGRPMLDVRRREFITLLGGAAATWPIAARAQQPTMPVIGFLNQEASELTGHNVTGFRKGLSESGFVENQNVAIEYRWAEARYERLPQLAAELVDRKVAVIASAFFPATLAAKAATSTIPIVFMSGVDPVAAGLVASLNRPGGNLTGLSNFNTRLISKRFELLHQAVPRADTIAVLVNPKTPVAQTIEAEARTAAQALGLRMDLLVASTEDEIDSAFGAAVQHGAGALLVGGDGYFNSRRAQFIALAARHRLPASFDRREIAMAGGLMSYGMNNFDMYRQVGIYTGQILKGAKPADLPVQQPTKVELVVNLKTAKSLGLELPTSVLLSADEVIE